jgi:hypothetical protein
MFELEKVDLIPLFFFLGMSAAWMKSDLEVPESVSKFLSIYLLLSLGLKGGQEVAKAASPYSLLVAALLGLLFCWLIAAAYFKSLQRKLGAANAASLAASFGSVSAVTYIAAEALLTNLRVPFSGHMVAVMAIMEVPAIIIALFYFRRSLTLGEAHLPSFQGGLFSAKSVVLLLGGFFIGSLMPATSFFQIAPVFKDPFKGVLAFFLLDLGILAQRQLGAAWAYRAKAIFIAILAPLGFGTLMLAVATAVNLERGDSFLLSVLAGSASYIAAPAAIRSSIQGANPSLYVALPLGLTFPFNLTLGLPYYYWLSGALQTLF